MADTIKGLAYEEAVSAINAQAGVLNDLRGRAGVLLAAASLVTAFLGGQALALPTVSNGVNVRSPIGGWGVVAIVAFVGVALVTLVVLWPYKWRFVNDPDPIIAAGEPPNPMSLDDVQAQLATYYDVDYNLNQEKLDLLFWAFRVASLLLVVETVAWIVDLRT